MTIIESASAEEDEPGSCTADDERDHGVESAGGLEPFDGVERDDRAVTLGNGGRTSTRIDRAWLHARLRAVVAHVGTPVERLSVLLIDDERMIDLHERHRGEAGTTDVLTFPESAAGEPIRADVAVNVDEASRQAQARRHPTERELLLYAVHGLLHCAGFDDDDEASARAMHAEEDRILRAIGVGPTFARDADPREVAP